MVYRHAVICSSSAIPKFPGLVINGCEYNAECNATKAAGSLECSVFGIRPLPKLEWDVDEYLPIKLENYNELSPVMTTYLTLQ